MEEEIVVIEDNNIEEINIEEENYSGKPYELPIASKDVLGGIKVGKNLTIEEDGTLNATGEISGDIDLTDYALKSEVPTKTSQLENDSNFINSIKTINGQSLEGEGNIIIKSGSGEINIEGDITTNNNSRLKDKTYNVITINHRGYSTVAPENTLPAYIISKEKGFNYVECDVSFTSDGVAVLLHDATIDRTSDGSGSVSNMTYEQLLQYDFGSWKSSEYAGTKIPTFEEFITLCKNIGLHPYIELKSNGNYTQEQIVEIVNMVKKNGMRGNVTYISFNKTYLEYIKQVDRQARLGYLVSNISETIINDVVNLRTGINEAFIDISYTGLTQDAIELCINNNLPLEIWTVNDENIIKNMNSYISGVTSDNLNAGQILSSSNDINVSDESDPTVPQHVKEITIEEIEKWNLGVEIKDDVEINDKIKRRWLYNPTTIVNPSINVWSLICNTTKTNVLPKGKYLIIYKASLATGNNGIATFNAGLDGVRLSNSSRSSIPLVNTLTSSGQITYYVEFIEEKTHTIDLYVYANVECSTTNVEIEFIRIGDIIIGEGITELPIASPTTLGVIKVGKNLNISSDGTLNAQVSGSGSGSGSEIISLDEQVIGTDKDGKILYKKTILSTVSTETSIKYEDTNIYRVVDFNAIAYDGTNTLKLPHFMIEPDGTIPYVQAWVNLWKGSTRLFARCTNHYEGYTLEVTIKYTKITD